MRDYSKITKPTPERYCAFCGRKMERSRINGRLEDLGAFRKRKYCNRNCMKKAFVKKDASSQNWGESHHSARKIVYLLEGIEKTCRICGSKRNIDIHHNDGNFHNNSLENLIPVCRSCHIKLHRSKMFIEPDNESQQLTLF